MKLIELQTILNDKVKVYVGKKIDLSKFHSELTNLIKDELNNFGNCVYYPWRVSFDISEPLPTEILNLQLDLSEDKRHKYKTVGVVNSIEFTITDKNCSGMTSKEISKIKSKEFVLESIEYHNKEIEKLKFMIVEHEHKILDLEKIYMGRIGEKNV